MFFAVFMKSKEYECKDSFLNIDYCSSFAGFSLSSWKENNSYSIDAKLPDYMKSKVEDILEIPGYRRASKCSRHVSPYWPTYNGWNHHSGIAFYTSFIDQ